jgi:putative ABC transport system permease protein
MTPPRIRPPRIAAALVALSAPRPSRADVVADLQEEYQQVARARGNAAAARWCWTQVLLSIVPLIRSRRGDRVLWTVASDLRFAARLARRAPFVTLSVIAAMGGGIAAATAIASVMEAVFFQPLPFTRPAELVQISTIVERFGRAPEVNYLDAADLRTQAASLKGVAEYDAEPGTARVDADAPALSITVLAAGRDLAAVLDLTAAVGRGFDAADFANGAAPVALLTNRFWRDRFAADPAVVGRTIDVGSSRTRIAGVLPPAADRFPAGGSDVWVPLTFPADSFLNQRGSIALAAIGRLRFGRSRDAAQAEAQTIAARLAAAYPDTNQSRRFAIDALQDAMAAPVRPMVLLIAAAVAMLLTVACANIANLLLAHAQARVPELALRAAIGASRGRLLRQLWTETLALFAVAGAAGVALAIPLAGALVARYPDALPLAADVQLDLRVLAIAAAVTLLAAVTAGLPLTRRASGWSVAAALGTIGRTTAGRHERRMSSVFVAAQVALSMVLLFGGLVLARTFLNLAAVPPGFDAEHLLTLRASMPSAVLADRDRMLAMQDTLRDTAAALPGVEAAAHAMFIPFAPGAWGDGFKRAGSADRIGPDGPFAHFYMVSAEYFAVMRLPLLRGRRLLPTDTEHAPRVLVVSDTFARRMFPGTQAVGQRIEWNDGAWEIVGVAADARHGTLWDAPDADVYVPRRQVPRDNTWLLLRTSRPAAAILIDLQRKVRALDPGIILSDVKPMTERLSGSAAPERFRALITSGLALLALALALVGLHGVVAYAVVRRTREIGIRLALGERPHAVRKTVVVEALRSIVAGLVPGIAAAWWMGRWLDSTGIVRADLGAALAAVAGVFLLGGLLAAAGPAWRASRVDPIAALRAE